MTLFKNINDLAGKIPLLDKIMVAFSIYVPLVFIIVLATFYIYGIVKKDITLRSYIFNTIILTVLNLLISFLIGFIYFVPRPFVNNKVNLLFPHILDASFPSDHAIGTMSIALGINNINKFYGNILILLSCIVGFSRVFVGHHYPLDVLGAFSIALFTNYIFTKLFNKRIGSLLYKNGKPVI